MVCPVSRSVSKMQGGIGAHHLAERDAELLLLRLGLGLHRDADHGVRESHALEHHRVRRIAQRIAGLGFGQRDQGDDVAGTRLFDGIGFLGEHLDHAADLLALAAGRILTEAPLVSTPEYTRMKVSAP